MKRIKTIDDSLSGWWFICQGDQLLIREDKELIPQGTLASLGLAIDSWTPCYELGGYGGQPCYLLDLELQPPSSPWGQWQSVRWLLSRLDEAMFNMAGRAWQVAHFLRTHRFCGSCGEPMVEVGWEVAMQCRDCGHRGYPRLSPAVIVAVTQGERLLLVRNRRHKQGQYSLLAGFVEAGETLEQAVCREVREEVGIGITSLQYAGSQPWPFPHNLMVAFTAEHADGEIAIDRRELVDANWYRADNLPPIPSADTIAGRMIRAFVAGLAK